MSFPGGYGSRAQIASLPIDRGQQDRYCIKGYLDKVELDQSPYTIGTSEGRAPQLQALEVPEAPSHP
jgi:hypothetical protein